MVIGILDVENEKVVGVKLFKFIIGYYYSVEGELFYFYISENLKY